MFGTKRFVLAVALIARLSLGSSAQDAPQAPPPTPEIRLEQDATIMPDGSIAAELRMTLPETAYKALKTNLPRVEQALRAFHLTSLWVGVEDLKGAYDDSLPGITATLRLVGATREMNDRFEARLTDGVRYRQVPIEHPGLLLEGCQRRSGVDLRARIRVAFPAGATDIRFDAAASAVTWVAPAAAATPDSAPSDTRVDVTLDARDRLMTCLYNTYSQSNFPHLWAARVRIDNRGGTSARDLVVRFRIDGYTGTSPAARASVLRPGSVLIEPFFPIFEHEKVLRLQNNTAAKIEVEVTFTDASGAAVRRVEEKAIRLLGIHEAVYTDLDRGHVVAEFANSENRGTLFFETSNLMAEVESAFVTPNDAVIKECASIVQRMIGGVAASSSDEGTILFARGLYDFMLANRFAYKSATGQGTADQWMENRGTQYIKYPREVLLDRSGTCIELAIFYAAVCQSAGVQCRLVNVPGHTFPAVLLPGSGQLIPVEVTGVTGYGALNEGPKSFAEVVAMGRTGGRGLDAAMKSGIVILVHPSEMHADGVNPPELEPLPVSVLESKGIAAPADYRISVRKENGQFVFSTESGERSGDRRRDDGGSRDDGRRRDDAPARTVSLDGVWKGIAVMGGMRYGVRLTIEGPSFTTELFWNDEILMVTTGTLAVKGQYLVAKSGFEEVTYSIETDGRTLRLGSQIAVLELERAS